MARTATNEGRCCDAVLRLLEAECSAPRRDVVRDTPERRGIDVTCCVGGRHYALEHTLIEPFPGNQRDDVLFKRVFEPTFMAATMDVLKPHLAYTLNVDVYAFRDLTSKQLTETSVALLAWTRAVAPHLPEPPASGSLETHVFGKQPEVPVRVRLACRRSRALGGQLLPERFAPEPLEDLRRKRLLQALTTKGPRLHAARRAGEDTRTVLIVENKDFALTSESIVSAAFNELATQVKHVPDDIYLVDTRASGAFRLTQVRRAGKACVHIGTERGDWEYTSADLDDI